LLGVHSRYGLHTRGVTKVVTLYTKGFDYFVTSIAAPVASGWSIAGWDSHPLEDAAFPRRTRYLEIFTVGLGDRFWPILLKNSSYGVDRKF
jgi:hypothetical protein